MSGKIETKVTNTYDTQQNVLDFGLKQFNKF